MKNINKDILKQLERNKFNEEILNDPLRVTYYTALKGYRDYLSTANLEGTPQSTAKFNKFGKELVIIMNTDLHVLHLLLTDLGLDKKLVCDYYAPDITRVPNWYIRRENPEYWHNDLYSMWKSISTGELNIFLFDSLSTLFPALVLSKYKPIVRLKVITKLLSMKLGSNITGVDFSKHITLDEFEQQGYNKKYN